jgi:Domain of unknown function (DUF6438)
MRQCSAVSLILIVSACAPRNTIPPQENSSSAPVITLERTACFGSCPVYRLAVDEEGKVSYQGTAHVRAIGQAEGRVAPERVQALLSELERAGYLSFAPRYALGEPACGRYATDLPSAISSITTRGQTKRIEHDHGCGAAPGALTVLEQRIDEVLGSARWTGR